MRKFQFILLFLVFLTSSFDVAFNLKLGGFNIRTCYFLSFVLLATLAAEHLARLKPWRIKILGFTPLLIWLGFQFAFAFQSVFLSRTIGYVMWLIFNLLMVEAIRQTIENLPVNRVLRVYLLSFALLAVFGLIQFAFGLVGISLFTAQWWVLNHLPRVNGLSYEPSYFSSYMLIGWVLCYFLTRKNTFLFSRQVQLGLLALMGVSIFLSTSRMGIVFVMAILGWDLGKMFINALITKKISRRNLLLQIVFVSAIVGTLMYVFADETRTKRYLQGTGVRAGDSFSRDERMRQMEQVVTVFLKSPFIGYSLGGVSPAIAESEGEIIDNQEDAKKFEGLNIYLEVLAASGVIGFLFFAWFMWRLLEQPRWLAKLLKRQMRNHESTLLNSIFGAMVAELLILALNQNILRPYLWIAIGLTNALYFKFRQVSSKPNEEIALH